jgi:hypothetical protein
MAEVVYIGGDGSCGVHTTMVSQWGRKRKGRGVLAVLGEGRD